MNINIDKLLETNLKEDRRSLARIITFLENKNVSQEQRQRVCSILDKKIQEHKYATRVIAFSGPPGVGKSTFIEKFGSTLCAQNKKVAVLAIDPSSPWVGGSILADKTRMAELSANPLAFIRPSPNKAENGGLQPYMRETVLACKAAGFDEILLETVGAGQSEIEASLIADLFIALYMPGSGDQMQAMKKGILEVADIVVVHKADGDLLQKAEIAQKELQEGQHLGLNSQHQKTVLASSETNDGHNKFHVVLKDYWSKFENSKTHLEQKKHQMKEWKKDALKRFVLAKYLPENKLEMILSAKEEDTLTFSPYSDLKLFSDL